MNPSQFFKSIRYAARGVRYLYAHEQNVRIQTVVAFFVVCLGFGVGLERGEWVVILLLIALVLILEVVNSVIERFIDIVKPRYHAQVQVVKDMLAAMVLFAAGTSFVIGMVIFWPYAVELLSLR